METVTEITDMLKRLVIICGVLMAVQPAFSQQSVWYEGGTLQKASASQWQAATSQNQLATAGDFIASVSGIADLASVTDVATAAELKKKAEDLQVCVNQSIKPETPPEQPVAEFIVRCTLLKSKQ
jgi:hypothetical protein